MHKIIIAIDGYSSCGKSTTAKEVAKKLRYTYIDTGAMYRAVTLYFLQQHVTITNPKAVQQALADINIEFRPNTAGQSLTYLNGLLVEDEIRKLYVADFVSEVSALADVRHALVAQQRLLGKRKGVVMDGRDIGTVVFPEAELKIFMTADPLVRAERRQIELLDKGELVEISEILENIQKRDLIDTTRAVSPLKKADDAILIDTSYITLEEQVAAICLLADKVVAHQLRRKLINT